MRSQGVTKGGTIFYCSVDATYCNSCFHQAQCKLKGLKIRCLHEDPDFRFARNGDLLKAICRICQTHFTQKEAQALWLSQNKDKL